MVKVPGAFKKPNAYEHQFILLLQDFALRAVLLIGSRLKTIFPLRVYKKIYYEQSQTSFRLPDV